jgi:tripeptidyl-peptidase I
MKILPHVPVVNFAVAHTSFINSVSSGPLKAAAHLHWNCIDTLSSYYFACHPYFVFSTTRRRKMHVSGLLMLLCHLAASGLALRPLGHRMHKAASVPSGSWTKASRSMPLESVIELDFVLAASETSLEAATQQLRDISNPSSANFGKFWTSEQVARHFAPPQGQLRQVARWLGESGISHSSLRISADRAHLYFNTTVRQARQMLGAEYYEYSDGKNNVQVASETYFLPREISSKVDLVLVGLAGGGRAAAAGFLHSTDLSDHAQILNRRRSTPMEINCLQYMSPDCLRRLYNIPEPSVNASPHPGNSFGIYQTAWATWIPQDLDKFFTSFHPALVGHRPVIQAVNGGYRQTETESPVFNLEANLDFEYAMSLSYPVPVTNIQVGDKFLLGNTNVMLAAYEAGYCETGLDPEYDPVYPDVKNIGESGAYNASDCGIYSPPLVISISYAWNEAWFSAEYVHRQCVQFLKLGLQGTTVIAASGDYGTADQMHTCLDPKNGASNASEGHFSSNFPASCPWITTIGGTQWQPQTQSEQNDLDSDADPAFPLETVFRGNMGGHNTSSGGGFSNVFRTPFYQLGAVQKYLNHPAHREHLANLSAAGYFDRSGRGWPDVSAMATNYLVTLKGAFHAVHGTSAAAPVFGSMIALINDARLKAGKGPVGFINPVLYAHHDKIIKNDVETGSNGGCGVSDAFPASDGWDAVTGLGSPDFEKLMNLYMSLP